MATYRGTDGVVKSGSAVVAEVTAFTLDTAAAVINDNAMGDDWDTHLVGRKSWSGTISANTDPTDTNGQVTLVEGATIAIKLYPIGDITAPGTQLELAGSCTITQVSFSNNHDNTVAAVTFSFTGNGALTRTAS